MNTENTAPLSLWRAIVDEAPAYFDPRTRAKGLVLTEAQCVRLGVALELQQTAMAAAIEACALACDAQAEREPYGHAKHAAVMCAEAIREQAAALAAQQPAASGEQAAQRDVRQADERGDEAMRRAHAAEDVLDLLVAFQAEYGRNAMDPDGMPGNEVYRPALQAIVNLAKATLGDSAGSSKAMSTVKAWIDSAALADAMDGAPR